MKILLVWWWEALCSPFLRPKNISIAEARNPLSSPPLGVQYFVQVPQDKIITLQGQVTNDGAMMALIESRLPFERHEIWAMRNQRSIVVLPKEQVSDLVAMVQSQSNRLSGLCLSNHNQELFLPVNPTRLPIKRVLSMLATVVLLMVAMQVLSVKQSHELAKLRVEQKSLLQNDKGIEVVELPVLRTVYDVSMPLKAIAKTLSANDVLNQVILDEDTVTLDISGSDILSIKAKLEQLEIVDNVVLVGSISSSMPSNRERARLQLWLVERYWVQL